ncbi:unannotated protein [freshwater metagenome]|uniref:Unannotated protein n=1 Tax=freshwater metagenome TaxID=449393 RepID=A0A6J7C304_9ZZZZ
MAEAFPQRLFAGTVRAWGALPVVEQGLEAFTGGLPLCGVSESFSLRDDALAGGECGGLRLGPLCVRDLTTFSREEVE